MSQDTDDLPHARQRVPDTSTDDPLTRALARVERLEAAREKYRIATNTLTMECLKRDARIAELEAALAMVTTSKLEPSTGTAPGVPRFHGALGLSPAEAESHLKSIRIDHITKDESEIPETHEAIHRLAAAFGLDEYTAQSAVDGVIQLWGETRARVAALEAERDRLKEVIWECVDYFKAQKCEGAPYLMIAEVLAAAPQEEQLAKPR